MKKKIFLVLLSLFIVIVLYAILVSRVHHKEIKVNASPSLVTQQFASLINIAKWYLPFASADTGSSKIFYGPQLEYQQSTLRLTKLSGLSAWFLVGNGKDSQTVVFSAVADTGQQTKVILSYESTLWNSLLQTNKNLSNAEKSLENLNDYFSDTKKMYGYQIEVTNVTDTAFLFTSKVVARINLKEAFKDQFGTLIRYGGENGMDYNGIRIFYISPYGNDSLHVFTSIGINNTASGAFNDIYQLKKMPYNGRLLAAYYQGSFGNVSKVLNAMDQFKSDHSMTTMAIPFVKLITEGIEFDDNQIVQAKAFFPVF